MIIYANTSFFLKKKIDVDDLYELYDENETKE